MSWKLQPSTGGGLSLHHSFPWANKYELDLNAHRLPSPPSSCLLCTSSIHSSISYFSCTQGCGGWMVSIGAVVGRRSPICLCTSIGQNYQSGFFPSGYRTVCRIFWTFVSKVKLWIGSNWKRCIQKQPQGQTVWLNAFPLPLKLSKI